MFELMVCKMIFLLMMATKYMYQVRAMFHPKWNYKNEPPEPVLLALLLLLLAYFIAYIEIVVSNISILLLKKSSLVAKGSKEVVEL